MSDSKISNLDLTNSEDYQLVHFGNESNMLYAVYAKVEVDCNNSSVIKQIDFLIRDYHSSGNDAVVFDQPKKIKIDTKHPSPKYPTHNIVDITVRERKTSNGSDTNSYRLSFASGYEIKKDITHFVFTTRPDLSGSDNNQEAIGDNCYESIIKVLK